MLKKSWQVKQMDKDIKEPKDLGVKIGTPEEAEWTKIKKSQEQSIRDNKINVTIAEIVLKLAEKEIAKEKEKFRKI